MVKKVEEGEDLGEVGVEHGVAGVARAVVEHVNNVKSQEDAGLVGRVGEVVIDEEVEEVGESAKAAINVNAELAGREEEGGKVRAEM